MSLFNKSSVTLVTIFSSFLFFVSWYDLTWAQIKNIELTWDKIIWVAQDINIDQAGLVQVMNTFESSKSFNEKQQEIFDQLILYIVASRKTGELIPRSIDEMKEKTFVGSTLVLEDILATNATYTRYRISYNSNGLSISGIMNIPAWDWPFPLVILNHGYIDPAVYTVGRGLKREQDYLARNGYAVLHTDYRNHGLSDSSADLNNNYYFRSYFYGTDSINAINAVNNRWDPRIDTTNVAMMGHSMGWWVTMHSILARPDLIDAAVLYAPVHTRERENFDRWRREDLSSNELQVLENNIWNISLDESFAPYSPASYLDEISIPLQYYHGTNDKDVPYERSVESVNSLKKTNQNIELITYEGEQHEFWFRWNDFMAWVVTFLDKELR